MNKKLTEEEKGKARVVAAMCGGIIPAWAMPENDKNDDKHNEKERYK